MKHSAGLSVVLQHENGKASGARAVAGVCVLSLLCACSRADSSSPSSAEADTGHMPGVPVRDAAVPELVAPQFEGGTQSTLPSAPLLPPEQEIRFEHPCEHPAVPSVTYCAWDATLLTLTFCLPRSTGGRCVNPAEVEMWSWPLDVLGRTSHAFITAEVADMDAGIDACCFTVVRRGGR